MCSIDSPLTEGKVQSSEAGSELRILRLVRRNRLNLKEKPSDNNRQWLLPEGIYRQAGAAQVAFRQASQGNGD
jgi:hypothetical protein